ncbi:MAG TPA: hypothetical protein VN905_04430 [Candidatus Binatia bacterium]|nr:hypothetical protein [Candidatus Binatia bacterium]
MQFEGTVTRVNDKRIAIVVVDAGVVDDPLTAGRVLASYQKTVFGKTPTVLFGRSAGGSGPQYFGPAELVAELSGIDPRRFRWHRYTRKTKA